MASKPKAFVVRPNAGITAAYRGKLDTLIAQMHADVKRRLLDQYRDKPPEMARDASPAADLTATMRTLKLRWQSQFNRLSQTMARHFAKQVAERNDAALASALRRNGFSVRLTMTSEQQDIVTAAVGENVSLIQSIASEYLTDVEGMVMRSVQVGRDAGTLTRDLAKRYGITRRRAALIATDQNNKATAALHRARQTELGLKAIWLHSAGGREPRKSHLAQSGKEYDPVAGWYDPDAKEVCWPGTLIGCRCVSKTLVPPPGALAWKKDAA